jgi:hypothetical protein
MRSAKAGSAAAMRPISTSSAGRKKVLSDMFVPSVFGSELKGLARFLCASPLINWSLESRKLPEEALGVG